MPQSRILRSCYRTLQCQSRLKGGRVCRGGVRDVRQRRNLLTKHERLLRLEKSAARRKIKLSQEKVVTFERFSPEFRKPHIEASHTRALIAVYPFFVGVLKGVGKIYLQSTIDRPCRHPFARL